MKPSPVKLSTHEMTILDLTRWLYQGLAWATDSSYPKPKDVHIDRSIAANNLNSIFIDQSLQNQSRTPVLTYPFQIHPIITMHFATSPSAAALASALLICTGIATPNFQPINSHLQARHRHQTRRHLQSICRYRPDSMLRCQLYAMHTKSQYANEHVSQL